MNNKILSMISICQKAGKLISGEFSCENSIKSDTAKLVLLATDASDNTKKKFVNKTTFYKVPLYQMGTRMELSKAIGKQNKVVFVVTDVNFSTKIQQLIEETPQEI